MNKQILTVTVNPSLDSFQTGKKVLFTAGGKGNNVARALQSLHGDVHALSTKGGETGKKLQALMQKEKIETSWVELKGETRCNLTLNNKHYVRSGTAVSEEEAERVKREILISVNQKFGVVFSGNILPGINNTFYAEVIQEIRRKKMTSFIAVDTRPEILLATLKSKPDIIKPNRQEAEKVLNFRLTNQKKIKEAVMAFCALGAKIVLLTLGSKGAVVGNRKNIYFVKASDVDVVRTVGCGDAFLGGFIFGFQNQLDIRACAVLGCSAGTASCTQAIPGRIPMKKFNELVHQIKIKQL